MCSSRISTRWTNKRSSGSKEIFAPFFLTFESGHEIVVLNILKKLIADAMLDILCGFEALCFQCLDIRWNINTPDVAGWRYSSLIDPPFGDNTVRIETFVQLRC